MAKKIKGSKAAKNQKFNVEDHIAYTKNQTMKDNLSPVSALDIPLPTPAS